MYLDLDLTFQNSCYRTFIFVLDSILDTLIGYTITKGWRTERERSEAEYEHSAQLCSIMARGTYTIIKVRLVPIIVQGYKSRWVLGSLDMKSEVAL